MIDNDIRRGRLTGTDQAKIHGVSDFGGPMDVYLNKHGLNEYRAPTMPMMIGKMLEIPILLLYEQITGREVEVIDQTFAHKVYPFMAWTPDARCKNESRIIDAKYSSGWNKRRWGDEPSPDAKMQMWWYLIAEDAERGDIALLIDGEVRIYTVERDREVECRMLEHAEEWWRRYIVGDERPPLTGSRQVAQWLSRMYPRNTDVIRQANESESDLLNLYALVRRELGIAKKRRALLEAQIKDALKDDAGLVWDGGRFTWKRTKDSTVIDWESMAIGFLQKYFASEDERQAHRELFTSIREGCRKVDFRDFGADAEESAA